MFEHHADSIGIRIGTDQNIGVHFFGKRQRGVKGFDNFRIGYVESYIFKGIT